MLGLKKGVNTREQTCLRTGISHLCSDLKTQTEGKRQCQQTLEVKMTTWVRSGKRQNRNFAVWEDNVEDVVSELEILKQKIRNLSGGPTSGGHEKCQRKLEKGKSPKGEKAKMKNKKGLEAQDEQHIDQIQVDGLPADQTLLKEKNSLQHDGQPDLGDLGVKTGAADPNSSTRIVLLKK